MPVDLPGNVPSAWVVLDWRDGKIVGLDVLDAKALHHTDSRDVEEPHAARMSQPLAGADPTAARPRRSALVRVADRA